jgi:diguanylate cyclase (GGDEF)-like protein
MNPNINQYIKKKKDLPVLSGNIPNILCLTDKDESNVSRVTQAYDRERSKALKLEEDNRNLQILASKDPLTGFYNKQFLIELLEKEWSRSQRYGYTLSIIMTEIDDFKKINDGYGHQIGDTVLKQIAEILYENLRRNDYLARYGEEEFLFVLPQADLRDAYNAAERFRRAVRENMMSFDKNDRLWLSISCGVCTAHPKRKDENVIASIQKADNALNEAKRLGKDRIVSYGVNHYSSVKKVRFAD